MGLMCNTWLWNQKKNRYHYLIKQEITKMLQKQFDLSCTKGYMYFNPVFKKQPLYFRRGV